MRLVHTDVGETDYKYWAASLKSHSIDQLKQGVSKAQDWTGFLTLGDFRKLCEAEKVEPCHKEFKALPAGDTLPAEELRRRLAIMREELGLK